MELVKSMAGPRRPDVPKLTDMASRNQRDEWQKSLESSEVAKPVQTACNLPD
ncbi:hypothetical protein KL86PLE_60302 [uncultured Pleomorphomonas sp.]|uniref:Uncharacterized protein n=1 Tax=uncultured Pleomorphomonas sp. TaxID=442121 RepID=A0A212LKF7_9HYPH|nr:hypothetical protein KL86PLE_60302 [uncultured Pleomorphomonas sp.]